MTEYARERIHHHQDDSLSAFADLFHHRLTLLFYRAWADAQPTVSLDRTDNRRFERYLASLIGMGQPGQLEKGDLSPHARFTHAGHLSRHGRDPEGLEKILRNFFKVPVNIISNVPQWMPLTPREQAQLGREGVCLAWASRRFSASRYAMFSINSALKSARLAPPNTPVFCRAKTR